MRIMRTELLFPLILVVLSGCALEGNDPQDIGILQDSDNCRSAALSRVLDQSKNVDRTGGRLVEFQNAYRACMVDKGYPADAIGS